MRIAIPCETQAQEYRVAATPDSVKQLVNLGFDIVVESTAGEASSFSDADYKAAGASIKNTAELLQSADIILSVQALEEGSIEQLARGTTLLSFLAPGQNPERLQTLADQGIDALAIDAVPRISRAQKMDALSSMANIAGYRAVIEAAHNFGRFFTGQITAAGKVPPAKVLVIGAGVAGLSAIGTARGMGAIVRAFDTRPAVKEQVESMGGEFLEVSIEEDGAGSGGYAKEMSQAFIDAEMALFREQAKEVDIVITTALIPGRPAPKLWLSDMVAAMKDGSVVVDLAGEQGGNCELTEPGEKVVREGVTIIGYTNLPSRVPTQASRLYAANIVHLLTDLCPAKDGQMVINMDDEVQRGVTVVKNGQITWPPPAPVGGQDSGQQTANVKEVSLSDSPKKRGMSVKKLLIFWLLAGLALFGLGQIAPPAFVSHFTVFVLACFVGWQVIWNVSHSLHTPLMSVTNAISGIIILGALLQISGSGSQWVNWLAFVSVLVATINIFGGFFVTQRMLKMFRK